jgi:hypothetical protein
MTQRDFERLLSYVKGNLGQPYDVTFLYKCFPNAFEKLIAFAREKRKNPWDLGTVQEFWRHHHDGVGDCAVSCVKIRRIDSNNPRHPWVIWDEKSNRIVLNLYDLELKTGDEFFIHRCVIVEKAESNAVPRG